MKKLFLFFAIIAVQNVCAETYRCTDANGKKVYSQIPCSAEAEKLDIKPIQTIKEVSTQKPSLGGNFNYSHANRNQQILQNQQQLLQSQYQLLQNQRYLEAKNLEMQREIEEAKNKTMFCNPIGFGNSVCF